MSNARTTAVATTARSPTTTSGDVTLKAPRLKKEISFEMEIIECYRRRDSSVEVVFIGNVPGRCIVRRVGDITEAL